MFERGTGEDKTMEEEGNRMKRGIGNRSVEVMKKGYEEASVGVRNSERRKKG